MRFAGGGVDGISDGGGIVCTRVMAVMAMVAMLSAFVYVQLACSYLGCLSFALLAILPSFQQWR